MTGLEACPTVAGNILRDTGVYLVVMFEQSMLLDRTAARKTGAFAASLIAEMLVISTLVLIPLIYSDKLPSVRPWTSMLPAFSPPPPARPVAQRVDTPVAAHRTSSAPVFRIPAHPDRLSLAPEIVTEAAPLTGSDVGVPGGLGAALPDLHLLSRFDAPVASARPAAKPQPSAQNPISVGGDVQAAKLIRKIAPIYPMLAKATRTSGTVHLLGVIAKDGTMQQLKVLSGHPLLNEAALTAVRQWLYEPTILDGQPVEVMAPIDVIFTLSQ